MKLNLHNPKTGSNKMVNIEDENQYRIFYGKRMSEFVDISDIGPEYKGYVCQITGGQDKQGFAMKQGVLVNTRVRLLVPAGSLGYQGWRAKRTGSRKRRSVRGCIVGADISVLSLKVVEQGETPIAGLSDVNVDRTLLPRTTKKLRKLFELDRSDDVRPYVVKYKKKIGAKGEIEVGPKIQRLITDERLRRKQVQFNRRASRRASHLKERAVYNRLLKGRSGKN
mmetsp:Transcript_0/g.1  ORF Transcript_0/g.1 Transcript_0/m.1 type:complete len:224 (-) Transcript_0:157-828(-)|eukprot:CAMPEP_0117426532 /NCGR_PEP_ID=MMETSP0758-20121206/6613_1 /TAXON_ID=63605 /ORGANISM="Percolomonas cosmopolitus, Strain AE-1 (ATCC 50343)" /LENGTH=223 /DNA_ID=CAMNT_0005211729 /DNA_START=39 /DNA_END=710 /DNA_ORIENTATION=+